MTLIPTRRTFVGQLAGAAALTAMPAAAASGRPIRAIAFDGFPIFDPRSVGGLAHEMFGQPGDALAAQWSNKLFGYTWLETAAGRYTGFETLADASLRTTAASLGMALDDAKRAALLSQYRKLDLWPDVRPALTQLKAAGLRLVFLSNLSADMLRVNMERNGITDMFEPSLSTDRVRSFKPSPRAYAMGRDALRLRAAEIGFAAFGGWDAVGATWFGYPTCWVNRAGQPAEAVGDAPLITSRGMDGVLRLAGLNA